MRTNMNKIMKLVNRLAALVLIAVMVVSTPITAHAEIAVSNTTDKNATSRDEAKKLVKKYDKQVKSLKKQLAAAKKVKIKSTKVKVGGFDMMLGKLYFTPAGKNTKSYLLTNEITEYYTGTVYMYDTKKVKGTWTTKVSKTKPVNPQIAKIKNKLDKAELNLAEAKQAISSDADECIIFCYGVDYYLTSEADNGITFNIQEGDNLSFYETDAIELNDFTALVVEYDTDYFYPDAGANGIRLISTDNVGETQVYVYHSTGKIMYTVNINITEWKSSDEYWDDED